MNKITRRFLSGASFFALALGLPTSAARAGITVTTAANGPVTVTNVQVTDFILVTGSGVVNGDILNEGFIISTGNAIEVGPSADVTGDIINEGFILAQTYGIVNFGHVNGNISNTASGQIIIPNTNMTGSEIAGIAVLNGDLGGIINDSGSMNVIGTGNFGTANGIQITNTGDLFATVHHGGSMLVVDAFKSTATFISVNAFGITAHASSDMGVVLTNSGKITVTAVGGGTGFVGARAFGFSASNGGNTDGATNNFARVTNAGVLNVVAAASGDTAHVTALAAHLVVVGGGASQAHATFVNAATGDINVSAFGNAATTGTAFAAGVRQFVFSATAIARASAVNDGGMHVLASAGGADAFATASGVWQLASVQSGGQATAYAANNGQLTVIAFGSGSAHVSATGVRQTAAGVSATSRAATAHATFSNGGTLFVSGHAIGTVSATATVVGVLQDVGFVSGLGVAKMYNAGDVTIIANAIADNAHAVAAGLTQFVDPATGTALFTNTSNASFKVTASAQATTTATATAKGIGQFVTASQIANAYVFNYGLIDITANASAKNTTAPAGAGDANAFVNYGIQQSALGAESVQAQIFNYTSATIDIGAHAYASGVLGAFASAKITAGIKQVANASGGGGSEVAHATLSNQGDIGILAKATAENAAWVAGASATIVAGISQFASATSSASVFIRNDGTIGITAQAIAHGSSSANAFASIAYGIAQQAVTGGGIGAGANATLSNFGTIDIKALATATASLSAVATALIVNGISQAASGSWDANVSLYNSGDINILAHAQVTANSAYDVAKISSGFYQRAYGSGFSTARVTLNNAGSGNITVLASAIAKGQNQASAWGTLNYGIAQHATSADTVIARLTNGGDIHLTAFAHATATNSAHAFAGMVFGVLQSANGDGDTTSFATVELHNSGVLGVLVSAKATAAGVVSANAHLSNWGVFQVATDAAVAHASITNAGTISVVAHAYAKGDAFAQAIIGPTSGAGIFQYAAGASSAQVDFNNTGGKVTVLAQATAIDTVAGGVATANAWVSGVGIRQIATSAEQAEVKLANTSGTIAIEALALASAPSGTAKASAFILTGIYQRAASTGTDVTFAKDVLTNDGTLDIIAQATAKGGSLATASAIISAGISQGAFGGDTASALLENNGQLNIWALAKATADNANANASMSVFFGIFQRAIAGDDNLVASVKLTNGASGTIQILDRATANGETHAFAHADLRSGIVQYATAKSVSAFLSNNGGNIFITAKADASAASGSASAYAFMVAGVFQHASANGTSSSTAVASLVNSGNINIAVNAKATGTNTAFAQATLGGWGIYQQATNAQNAQAKLDNSGNINIVANAYAAGSQLTAFAGIGTSVGGSAAGIYQSASALNNNSSALVSLINQLSATINIVAQATATTTAGGTGFSANASAFIDSGIVQQALGAGNEDVVLDNSGFIFILASANAGATFTGAGSAQAFINRGIYQHAVASSGTANITLSNAADGRIAIIADADAGAWNNGNATATLSVGISQLAQFASNATLTIANNGLITVAARAQVFGSPTSATAIANIATGIAQSANVSGSTAKAIISGSGHIIIEAAASAVNVFATATASAHILNGISQNALGGSSNVTAKLAQGTVSILAHATASGGGPISALADIRTGIYQNASSPSGANALAEIVNTNEFNVIAAASAIGDTGAPVKAFASIENQGIIQLANASNAQALLGNAGVINIEALAHADGDVTATAYIGTGIDQSVLAVGTGTAKLTNTASATINIVAKATATGVSANAKGSIAFFGIRQAVVTASVANALLTNDGDINILAKALANATAGAANAYAEIATAGTGAGIGQYITAAGSATGLAIIDNSGKIDIAALATANGVSAATATAKIYAGISQSVSNFGIAKAQLIGGGDVTIAAVANASATGGPAKASASIITGIYQLANANAGGSTSALASIAIGGGSIAAIANATGLSNALAIAELSFGIRQFASGGTDAKAFFSNIGDFNIAAAAKASAVNGSSAGAYAYMVYGVFQYASANGTTGSKATASLINSGDLAVVVDASAIASASGTAYAQAILGGWGIYQQATSAANAQAVLNNSGNITILAHAFATGAFATALAEIGTSGGPSGAGIFQSASALNNTSVASVSLINQTGGAINIVAQATASTNATTSAIVPGANAGAFIYGTGIDQVAQGAADENVKLDNAGLITIAALAKASAGWTGNATASAYINKGIVQHAVASSGSASIALTNQAGGAIVILASASASAWLAAKAAATVSYGISQLAQFAATATLLIANSGSITVAAIASGVGLPTTGAAFAKIGTGIHQSAQVSGASADLAIANSGKIVIEAAANANGWSGATATALIVHGISQIAGDGDIVSAKLTGAGTVDIVAAATADANGFILGTASALASIGTGIFQSANGITGGTSALASISIGGGGVLAFAKASGSGAKATALIAGYGIHQIAIAGSTAEAAFVNNSGAFTIGAIASAFGGSDAGTAFASISHGVAQFASATSGQWAAAAHFTNKAGATLAILASANATGASGAKATADNYLPFAQTAQGGQFANATLANSGNFFIGAIAHADASAGPAKAYAYMTTGVYQLASANGVSSAAATVNLTNSGNFTILASAKATGTGTVTATATITNYGIYQQALNGDQGNANLNNSGTLNILALAYADGDVTANAFIQTGIKQSATGAVTASATLTNAGTMNIVAAATAIGTPAYAIATLSFGINQFASNATNAKAFLSSTGPLNIMAAAKASAPNTTAGSSAGAYAYMVYGVKQYASANGTTSSFATASLINSGDLAIVVSASAIAQGTSGIAYAQATLNNWGIYQQATSAENVSAVLDNSGDITIVALAHALGGGDGGANATAIAQIGTVGAPSAVGIFQSASALNNDFTASVSLLNGTGAINIVAQATAATTDGTGTALAQAFIYNTGILQVAQGAGVESIKLDNEGGTIAIAAIANAQVWSGAGTATALVGGGIYQHAVASSGTASIDLTNAGGNIVIMADADAAGWFAPANAKATLSFGIGQLAEFAATATLTIANSGSITIAALAHAHSVPDTANALAKIATGIFQTATVTGASAHVLIDNSGKILIEAAATAVNAAWIATASADIGVGISQNALDGSQVSAKLTGAGTVDIVAQAVASANSSRAWAFATIVTGIYQTANAVTGGSSALASISIGGGGIVAHASADGFLALAEASIKGYGIYQKAIAGSAAEDDFINNSGAFTIGAIATATGTAWDAQAHATIANGIYQFASATGSTFRASASIWNNPGATLAILASANAHGATKATASAYNYNAVYQSALGGKQAVVGIYNTGNVLISGNVLIGAIAHADATGPAKAYAYMSTAVYQFASAGGGVSPVATAVLSNSGNFTIIASAKATGTGTVSATAIITNYGIYQQALNGDAGQANLNNSGTLNILAFAHAVGDVVANATIGTGIYQTATGVVSATAFISNTSLAAINIIAKATAATTVGGATATANAGITGYGIYQVAKSASAVLASISNAGVINIAALAKASATNTGVAFANATIANGIYQFASAGNGQLTAVANIFNSGTIAIVASAKAVGVTNASATAYNYYGIKQQAYGAGIGSVAINGGGDLTIAAIASASAASGFASGYAFMSTGIYQYATAFYNSQTLAKASISVGGGAIMAVGNAKGTSASASGYIRDAIGQYAYYGDQALINLKNTGTFNIAAIANATATVNSASAYAYINYGIYQYASGGGDRVSAAAAITNSGTMAIIASAFASGVTNASASAYNYYGIEQYAYGAANGNVAINGGGILDIAAIASAKAASGAASGYAYIGTGIYQSATAAYNSQTLAKASVSVGGGGILAVGNAKGTSADALAYINDYAIYQAAYYGDQALINLKNTGTFNIAAIANATATVNSASAYAYLNYGIYQYALASGDRLTAAAIITNTGSLGIVASANAVGVTNASASAYLYYGIQQYAYGAQKGTVALNGNGIVDIAAIASASAASGYASGYAYMYTGIYQSATAFYGSQTQAIAAIDVSGGGIFAIAGAKGTSASASAYIQYYGINQNAYYGDLADVSLKNTGVFNIAAIASASASVKSASAYAYISYGIYQYAYASGDQLTASAGITNSGTMAIIASAKAVGVTNASATAYLYYGIQQYAYSAGKGNAVIDGGGVLSIAAIASASAVSGFASGYAFMYTGIYQSATATAGFTSANALIDVNGGGVIAVGNAKGTSAYAFGSISAYGIYQYATGGDSVSAKLLNSGVFDVAAVAYATGTAKAATASAYLYTGIYQYAAAGNLGLTAIASIDNSGTLAVIASAHAVGGTKAVATASITNYGIYQLAVSAGIASAKIVGGGNVTVAAIANATAAGGPASAYAFLSTGIYQYATAGGNSNTSAVVSMDVGGGGVMAVAHAKGTTAQATASITETGIYQYASGGDYAAANFKNTGVFNIAALANATATLGFAFASATVSTAGIYQEAYAGDDKLTAAVNFTNSGTMAVIASAHAKGATGASAIGYMNYAVSQLAYSANDAGAELHNSGDLFIGAGAGASATAGAAFASALLVTGIYQYVYGTAGSGAQAHASLTNTGKLIVFAQASAKGTTSVSALASISGYGIYQYAFYGDTAKVAIQNSGTLAIEALAFASGDVFASAYIATGIYQSAYATNNYVAATAAIGNTVSGVINIAAIATAIAALGSATASAYLSGYGIYQHAYSADTAVASIVNDGAIGIFVVASASAVTGPANAYAIIGTTFFTSGTGIYQSASATNNQNLAQALIDNSGSIDIVAQAIAKGASSANATAYVLWGISQFAFNAAVGTAKLTGGGTVNVAAIASASASTGFANAYASIITGIYQSVDATNSALVSIDVGGGMVAAIANAQGASATASALISTYGIFQSAWAATSKAVANFHNDGTFNVAALASASGSQGGAFAHAYILTGIYQYASASTTVTAQLTNDGHLAVVASAQALGATNAVASATLSYGISQYAVDGGDDFGRIQNNGVLNVAVIAGAEAASGAASAHAAMIRGIYQTVTAYWGSTLHTALAEITNGVSATMAVIAQANAKGTTAVATATISTYGIYQAAYYGTTNFAGIQNSGVLDVAAIANATGTSNAAAAFAFLSFGIYQYAYASYDMVAATVSLNNNGGTLAVIASANADGQSAANATATVHYGIQQYALLAGLGNAILENSGEIDVIARASAVAANGPAFAHAFMYTGIAQSATAFYGSHTRAFVSLSNAGTLAVMAAAQATGDTATANATISSYGIYQNVNYGDAGTVSLFNSGTLEVAAIAGAVAAKTAQALAIVNTGIYQFADVSQASNTAAVNLTNATSGKLEVFAFASATGNPANASAIIGTGIRQSAVGADADFAFIGNSGTLNIAAIANAVGDVTANALITNGIVQLASNTSPAPTALATLTNSGKLFVTAAASAIDTGAGSANAVAHIVSHGVYQQAFNGTTDSAVLENSGILGVNAIANVSGNDAFALAWIEAGIGQLANGVTGEAALASITNDVSATLVVVALASAVGGPTATATAFITRGISQVVSGVQTGTAVLVNSGLLEAAASADAAGGAAVAQAVVIAVGQNVVASSAAFATMVNAGTFIVMAAATALGGAFGSASAFASGGPQVVSAPGTAFGSIVNSGTYEALAHASATGNNAYAKAIGLGPQQTVIGGGASALFANSGTFIAQAVATALGGATGLASAIASGISQSVVGGAGALAEVDNNLVYEVLAFAKASGNQATAFASALGLFQAPVAAGGGTAAFFNSSVFVVHAKATASGVASGFATASAAGVVQFFATGGSAIVHNAATFVVSASANAFGATALAVANAAGAVINGGTGAAINVDVLNTGIFNVAASANDAVASAIGVLVTYSGTGAGGKVSGTIENDATMLVTAIAPGGTANALGIGVFASQFTGGIFNSGVLQVFAKGSSPAATAILIGNGGATGATGTGTITNEGGTIWAGISNGTVILRGTAIDVSGAPNAIVINLEGNSPEGIIFGNIKLSPNNDDTINVINGKTIFDGGINPDGDLFGTLNVGGGTAAGTLEFVNNPVEGQAYAYVNSYNQFADGTIFFHVDPDPDPDFVFIHADNASLDGTIQVDFAPGDYFGGEVWRIVLSNDPISGTWDTLDTNFPESLFLHPEALYTTFEADIVLARAPFTDFCQETKNNKSFTQGLENGYSPALTGPFAALMQAILFLNSEDEFCDIVDQLKGEEIGQTAFQNLDSAEILKDAVGAHLQAIWGGPEQLTEMRTSIRPAMGGSSRLSIWGGAYGEWGSLDRTDSGPGFDSGEHGLVGGADLPVGPNTLLGIAGSWTADGDLDFDNNNDGSYDGYQLGVYMRHNAGNLYLQALAAFGDYSNDTRRFVSVPGFGSGVAKGSFNSDVWQLYGEGGWHITTSGNVDLVPYAALHYLRGDSDAYTEKGFPGVNLHVSDVTATSFSSYLGARLAILSHTLSGGTSIVPTLKVAWQHEFEDTAWSVNAAFDGVPATAFHLTGDGFSKDSLIAGGELAISWGSNVDAVIDYEGRFNGDRHSNAIIGRLNFRL